MEGKVVRVQKEVIKYQNIENKVVNGVVKTVLGPVSFLTWITPKAPHVVFKVEEFFTFKKKNGGILKIEHTVKFQDFKNITVQNVYESEDVFLVSVKLDDAWNAYNTNAEIEFKITERSN